MSAGWFSPLGLIDVEASAYPPVTQGTLLIAGVDRTDWLKDAPIRFTASFNSRGSFSAQLEDKGRGFVPLVGMSLIVLRGSQRRWGGFITQVNAYRHPTSPDKNWMLYTIKATDNNLIADRRLVYSNTVFVNGVKGLVFFGPGFAGDIVRAIASYALTGEGVLLDGVTQGPYLASAITCFYETFGQIMNKICQLTGFRWRIDENQVLQFGPFLTTPAPFTITEAAPKWRNLTVSRDTKNYRNVQHVRTESSLTAFETETFIGDGVTADFFIGLQGSLNPTRWMVSKPTVTLDDVALTVGGIGQDDIFDGGYDCWYDPNGIGVHFSASLGMTVPGVGEVLSITYEYIVGNVVTATDPAEIADMAAISGGSGQWENVDEQRNIRDGATLLSIAEGDLEFFGLIPTRTEYEIDEVENEVLQVGQAQTLDLPAHGITTPTAYLIEEIDTDWIIGADFIFRQRVRLTDIGPMTAPVYLLEKLAEVARIGVPRVSAVTTDNAEPGGGGGSFAGRESDGSSGNYLQTATTPPPLCGIAAKGGPWTIAFWTRADSAVQNRILFQAGVVGSGAPRYGIDIGTGRVLRFKMQSGIFDPFAEPGSLDTSVTLPDGNWHHVCYRKNAAASSSWDKFLDGAKTEISAAAAFELLTPPFPFSCSGLRTELFGNGSGTGYIGALAEFAVWAAALTDAEVSDLAAAVAPSNATITVPVSYWPITGAADPELDLGSNGSSSGGDSNMTVHGSLPATSGP